MRHFPSSRLSTQVCLVLLLASSLFAPQAMATVTAGADASVWDSAVPVTATLFPIGGSGQLNGEFILDTVDLGGSVLQVGIRAQERFVGPSLTRVGNVYFATPGTSGGGSGATWNYDIHIDFGTSDTLTTVPGSSLESQILQTLTPLSLREFTVEFLLDTDPTSATDFTVNDINEGLDGLSYGEDVYLFQTSLNMLFELFGSGPAVFDPDADGIYDFEVRVRDLVSGDTVARTAMKVVVGDMPVDTLDIGLSQTESVDPVVLDGAAEALTYVITATNAGPAEATDLEITQNLTLPTGVSVTGTPTASSGIVSGASPTYTWTLPTLASGASATLTVPLTVDATAPLGTDTIVSTATVTSVNEPDASAFNDSTTQSTSITCPDADADGVCDADDNCPITFNTDQQDTDGDGNGNACDLCFGDDAEGDSDSDGVCDPNDLCLGNDLTGDGDGDGICADRDCDDADGTNACEVFRDGFESGDTSMWTATVL